MTVLSLRLGGQLIIYNLPGALRSRDESLSCPYWVLHGYRPADDATPVVIPTSEHRGLKCPHNSSSRHHPRTKAIILNSPVTLRDDLYR